MQRDWSAATLPSAIRRSARYFSANIIGCAVKLKEAHKSWDDDRLFQTARMINLACALKVVIEDYINALAGELGTFQLVPGFADKQRWYRTNRISIEFNLLYRWHGLVPDKIILGNERAGASRLYVQ